MTLTPSVLAARIAPSTSGLGAWSAPMASTAIVTIMEGSLPRPFISRPLRSLHVHDTARNGDRRGVEDGIRDRKDIRKALAASNDRGHGAFPGARRSVFF